MNGNYYVGSTTRLKKRLSEHRLTLTKNIHPNPHLQAAWNKYGAINFDFFIVEESATPKLREQDYLNVAKTEKDKCYNTSFVVDHPPRLTGKREQIRRERLREAANRAYREHPEIKQKLREATLLQFKDKISRIELSRAVKTAMKDPAKLLKISLATRDKTVYHFSNRKTGVIFQGTRIEFRNRFGLKQDSLCGLMSGKRNSLKGWIVEKTL